MTRKLVIFDFCDTISVGQTASPFLSLVLKRTKMTWFLWEVLRRILRKIKVLEGARHKKFQVLALSGVSKDDIDAVAEEFVLEHLKYHKKMKDKIEYYTNSDFDVFIVSGGFSEYIELFTRSIAGHVTVIANSLQLREGRATGKLSSIDCMGINKIELINQCIDLKLYDLNSSCTYTDHVSDLPILLLVGNRYFVSSAVEPFWAPLFSVNVIPHD